MTPPPDDDLPATPDAVSGPGDAADPLAALLGGAGPGGSGGGFDFGALMEQAGALQSQMLAAQQQAAATVVEGVAGGGAVKIAVTGGFEFQSVTISPDAVDPDDVDLLQDLVLAALNDAVAEVQELQQGGLELGDLDIGGLLGGS